MAELNRRIREEGGYRGMLLRGLGGLALGIDFYLERTFLPEAPGNLGLVSDPRVEEMIRNLGELPQEAVSERKAQVLEIDSLLAFEAYMLPMPGVPSLRAHGARVRGFRYQPTFDVGAMLQETWIGEHVDASPASVTFSREDLREGTAASAAAPNAAGPLPSPRPRSRRSRLPVLTSYAAS